MELIEELMEEVRTLKADIKELKEGHPSSKETDDDKHAEDLLEKVKAK